MRLYQPLDLPLQRAVKEIKSGKIQLPEFQRMFRWPLRDRKALLDSIQKGYPVGSLLLLEVGSGKSPFGVRPFEHVSKPGRPNFLVLDGQQRLATCYTAFVAERPTVLAINLRLLFKVTAGKPGKDLDLSSLLVVRNRPAALEDLLQKDLLPLPLLSNDQEFRKKLRTYRERLESTKATAKFGKFIDIGLPAYLDSFFHYEFPCVVLPKHLDLEAVCNVFTKINTTGLKLSAFDLCVATLYPEKVNLRELLKGAQQKHAKLLVADPDGTNLLQAIALLSGSPSKKAALPKNISAMSIKEHWNESVVNLVRAADLLTGLGVWDNESIPYDALIPALAAALSSSKVSSDGAKRQEALRAKVARWVYQTALAERYNEGTDVKQHDDFVAAKSWLADSATTDPQFLIEPVVWTSSLIHAGRTGARAKAIIAAMNQRAPSDFMKPERGGHGPGRSETNLHHIFPRAYLRNHSVPDKEIDRIFNLTFLSADTNIFMSERPPSSYIPALVDRLAKNFKLHKTQARDKVRQLLYEHFVDDEAFDALVADDYEAFISARANVFRQYLWTTFGVVFTDPTPSEEAPEEESEEGEEVAAAEA